MGYKHIYFCDLNMGFIHKDTAGIRQGNGELDGIHIAGFIFLENFDPVVIPCRYGGVCGTEARFVR